MWFRPIINGEIVLRHYALAPGTYWLLTTTWPLFMEMFCRIEMLSGNLQAISSFWLPLIFPRFVQSLDPALYVLPRHVLFLRPKNVWAEFQNLCFAAPSPLPKGPQTQICTSYPSWNHGPSHYYSRNQLLALHANSGLLHGRDVLGQSAHLGGHIPDWSFHLSSWGPYDPPPWKKKSIEEHAMLTSKGVRCLWSHG